MEGAVKVGQDRGYLGDPDCRIRTGVTGEGLGNRHWENWALWGYWRIRAGKPGLGSGQDCGHWVRKDWGYWAAWGGGAGGTGESRVENWGRARPGLGVLGGSMG